MLYTPLVEDADLRRGLAAGDLNPAFRRLREQYGRSIYGVCMQVLRDAALAEEAMQETFARAYRQRSKLASADSLSAYLLKMARNIAIDHHRTRARRATIDRAQRHEAPAPAEGPTAIEPAVRDALADCLDGLEPTTRLAVIMHHRDDQPWQEIAAIVDLPLDTIRMRAKRALAALVDCLTGKGVEL